MVRKIDPLASSTRRGPRYSVEDVQGTLHFNTEARVLNVSLAGVALETSLPVRVGRSYTVTLRHDDEETISLSATVVWCHLQGTRRSHLGESLPIYAAGLAFDDTLTENASQLIRFLQRAAIITVGQRVTGRFRFKDEKLISLKTEYDFSVKNVSSRGLLLETELSPQLGAMFEIEVFLPAFTLQTRARVIQAKESRLAEKRTVSEVEMEFVEFSPSDQARLSEFIASELRPLEPPQP
jgi:hypothetical protein